MHLSCYVICTRLTGPGGILQGLHTCGLTGNPASSCLTQLTLLSLRGNRLSSLAGVLAAGRVHSLAVLDLSDNKLGQPPEARSTPWNTANVTAFPAGGWRSLQVLGIRPGAPAEDGALESTAQALEQLVLQGRAAQQPQLTVVHRHGDQEGLLLRGADELGAIL